MNILFCSQNPVDARLGASKVIIELADAMRDLGWQCTIASDQDIAPGIGRLSGIRRISRFSEALREFLHANAAAYDVVDYDHIYLPYPREEFSRSTLMVARSVLLIHHFDRIKLPRFTTMRSRAGSLVNGPQRWATQRYGMRLADRTLRSTDLINLCNKSDRIELERRGFQPGRIVVIPFGLTAGRLEQFSPNRPEQLPELPRVAFVGTLDLRKGAREMPEIVECVMREIPQVKVRLLGARNLTVPAVMELFPKPLRARLEIYPEFAPEELPGLLNDCSVGVFPSRIEGFPFGVLEMLAAALPVVAYDVPGPPMMLSADYLVPRGDAPGIARKVVELLSNRSRLLAARRWAKNRSTEFEWERSAQTTSGTYIAMLNRHRREMEIGSAN